MILINFLRDNPGGNFIYTSKLIEHITQDKKLQSKVIVAISTRNLSMLDIDVTNLNIEVHGMPSSIGKAILCERRIIKNIVKKHKGKICKYLSPNTLFPFFTLPNVKMFSVIHDLNFLELPTSIFQKIYKYFLYQFTAIIAYKLLCISHFTRNEYSAFSFVDIFNKSKVIYNGVDCEKLCEYRVLTSEKRDYALSFGHQDHKNVEESIKLINQYNNINKLNPLSLKVVGAGPYIDKLKIKYVECAFISWVGRVDEKTLYKLLAHARFLLFLSKYEGFGLPVFEAFSLGTVAVISQQKALTEISSGHAIVHYDVCNTAEEMKVLLENEVIYKKQLESALNYVKPFSWTLTFDRLFHEIET